MSAGRRWFGVSLCAWLCCGSGAAWAQEDARPKLLLWHAYRGQEKDALAAVVDLHNAKKESPFTLEVLSIPYDALVDKITAAVPRGRGPDLFIFAHDTIGDWAQAGILHPLDGQAGPQVLASFLDETLPPLIYQGKLYGLPLAFKSVSLIYRTDLVPTPPKTTDELKALAKVHTRVEDQKYGLVYENGLLYFHAAWLFGYGGALFDAQGRPTLATPANAASLEFAQSLAVEHLVPQETNGALVTALMAGGNAAMAISGPWLLGDLPPELKVAVAPLPVMSATGQRARPFLTTEAVFVSQKSAHVDLAVQAALWLAGEESANIRLRQGGQPVAYRAAWDGLPKDQANLWAFKEQLSHTVPTPNTPSMKSLWSPMDNALSLVLHGIEPAAAALAAAQAKVEGVMAKVEQPAQEGPFHGFTALMLVLAAVLALWLGGQIQGYRKESHFYDRETTRRAYVYSLPALVSMVLLTFIPFGLGIGMGFFRHTYGRWDFVGLSNYRDLLTGSDGRFLQTLLLTVAWTVINVALHVGIGLTLALLLNRPQLKGRAVYRVLLIIPWAVPSYITALIWKGMFHPDYGVVNEVLALLGFSAHGMSWMAHPFTAFLANLITNTWLGFPFMMVVCLGALQSIPVDLYEAARLDGASAWQQFTRITLPLLRPALLPAVLLGSVWTFNQFNVVYLVSGGGPDGKTDLLVTEAFRWAFERGPGGAFGLSAAYSTLIFLILLGYSLLVNRYTGSLDKALD